jgi:hypothetical protein
MPNVKQHLFGPGSMEMIRLDIWTDRSEPCTDRGPTRRLKVRVVGQYDVYCGMGNLHRIDIKAQDMVWDSEPGSYTQDFILARDGDQDAAERIATSLIEWEYLEDWTDPCDQEEWDDE